MRGQLLSYIDVIEVFSPHSLHNDYKTLLLKDNKGNSTIREQSLPSSEWPIRTIKPIKRLLESIQRKKKDINTNDKNIIKLK